MRKLTFRVLTVLFYFLTATAFAQINPAQGTPERSLFHFQPDGSIRIKGEMGHQENPDLSALHRDEAPVWVNDLPASKVKNECTFYGGDSLSGFDFELASRQAIAEGNKMYSEFRVFMFRAQSAFVKKKYGIAALPFETYLQNQSQKNSPPYSPANAACVNMDFENGDFTNWVGASGYNQNSNAFLTAMGTAYYDYNKNIYDCADLQLISSVYGNDPISGQPGLCPTGGTWSSRIGGMYINEAAGYSGCAGYHWSSFYSNGEYIRQTFTVTAANALVSFDYHVILNDGGHPNGQQPYFHAYVTNAGGTVLSTCTQYYVQATAGSPPAGFYNTGYTHGGGPLYAKGWTSNSMNLTPYIGQTVNLYFIAAGCTQGGHPAWAYIDGTCGPATITASSVNPCSGTTAVLTAPAVQGGSYSWSGPSISGSTTGQSINVTGSGTYTCIVTPSQGAGCAYTLTQAVNFITSPTAAPTAAPATLCSGNSTTLTANATNATSYNWSPGGSTSSSVVVTPGVGTTIYTLTVTNGGLCPLTRTVSVNVTATPTVNITGTSSICSGSSTTLSGSGATSYTWSPSGLNGSAISVNPSSTTTYTLTGANGSCLDTHTITVNVTPTPTLSITGTTTLCSGSSTTLTGGTATNYTWSPGGQTTNTISVSPSSTTTYTLTGANGSCTATRTVTVNVTATPTLSISGTTSICSGNSTTLTGGTATNYTWSPGGQTTNTISVSPSSTTTYTLTGANGSCTATRTVTVNVTATPTLSISGTTSICSGNSTTLTGGTASGYTWSPGGQTTNTISVSPSSTTTYTLTGANGSCTATRTVTVNVTATPTVNISGAGPLCSGQSLVLTGGTATNYTWSPGGQTTNTVSVSPSSTTTYTLTGANGTCTANATASVSVTPTPTVNITGTTSLCSGQSTVLTGATASSYSWSTGATTNTISVTPPVGATTYTLVGSNGTCSVTRTVTVNVTATPTVSISGAGPLCSGQSLVLTGGTATNYTWSPGGQTTNTVSVSPSSTTTYTLTGANGTCTASTTASVSVTPTPTVNITGTTSLCSGQSTVLTGATASSYSWSTGATTNTISVTPPVGATTYTLVGSNGTCSVTRTVTVNVTATPTVSISGASPICSGQSAVLTGGTATNYTWMPGGSSASTITVTPGSTTSYTLTGANGTCTANAVASVSVTTTPTVSISGAAAVCSGTSVTLNGGTATNYTWSPGGNNSSSISVSPNTTTSYTLVGANGTCTASAVATVTVTTTPTVSISGASAICSGTSVTLTGGVASSFTWSPGGGSASTVTVTPNSTTTYTLTGANGTCTASAVATITVTATPTVSISGAGAICNGQSVNLTGGTATSYTWNPGGSSTSNISVTPGTTTTYTLTGANGTCTASAVATVTVNSLPVIGTASITSAPCGQSTGCINSVSVSGGTPTYTYSWNGGAGSTSSQYCNQPAGTYVLLVTDANGCQATQNFSIPSQSGPAAPNVTASNTVACEGSNVSLSVSPVTGGITYTWTDNTGTYTGPTYTVTNIGPSGNYNVSITATDGSGCVSTPTTLTITVNPLPALNTSASPTVICNGQSTTLNVNGATTYTWSSNAGSATTNTVSVNPSSSTVYTVTGNSLGCTATETVAVTVNPLPSVTASSAPATICAGQSTVLTAGGATTYTWSTSATTQTISVSPSTSAVYTVTGETSGCTSTQTVAVTVTPLPAVSITPAPASICVGQSSVLTAGGATTYTWSANAGGGSATTVTVSPSATTSYTLAGSQNGCSDSTVVTITIGTPPTISTSVSQNTICSGTTTTLSASGASSYTWMPGGATTGTITVSPNATTVYTVSATAGGCPSTETVAVTVNPTPTIAVNASANNICSGQTTTLSASGATSYTWMPGSATSGTITVSPNTTTTYTLTGDDQGCVSQQQVTVNVTATPTLVTAASQTAICSGTSTNVSANGAASYTWSPGGATTGTISVSPTSSTVYTVTGANGNCLSTETVAVNVTPTPTISANASAGSICSGNSVTLSASGSISYTWSPGGATSATITVTPNTTTTYTVISDSAGCSAQQQVTVNVSTTPTVSATSTQTTLCSGQSATLNATGATSYTWSTGGTNSTETVSPVVNTTYTVIGVNGNCSDTAMVNVTVNPTPTVSIASTGTAVCAGSTATLTASGATNYTWMPGGATSASITDTPAATTTYTVTGENSGCISSQQVTVIVNPTPTMAAVANQTVCSGSPVNAINYGAGTATVNWSNTNPNVGIAGSGSGDIAGYSAPNVATPEVAVVTATPVDNGTGCSGAAQSYTIIVNPTPQVSGGIIDSALCGANTGGISGISVTGGTPGYSYQWYNNGVLMPGETNATLSNVGMGSYSVAVTDTNGCTASGATTTFTVNGSVAVAAGFTADVYAGQAPLNVNFTNLSNGATVYNWNFGNGSSAQQNPGTQYTSQGTYTVVLTAMNGGCLDTAMAVIIVDAATSIVIPNIYSPNGDGVNDVFMIMCSGMRKLKCDIFNRWGQLVYTLKGPNDVWDGIMNNGLEASEGTYYYILDAEGFDDKAYKAEGHLTLVK